jgi:multiple sugar transport system ATP-binding protein
MAEIILRDVVKRFGDNEVIKKLNLTIDDREFVVLLGASGCGKTTTLRAIAGLEEIDGGEILIDGGAVQSKPARDRDIAFVFQLFALYPHLSAFNNIAFPLKAAGTRKPEIDKRVRSVAAILQIEPLLESMPSAMSGGDMQRVSMARALVRDPKALLMDEPMGTLDAKLREELRAELKHLHIETGSTTVYVTHDQVEAMSMGDKIAIMDDGVLQQIGKPKDVYDNPANIFVAQFIGSPVMNMIDCRCDSDGDVTRVVLGHENTDTFQFSRDMYQKLQEKGGDRKSLAVGIRPEAVLVEREPVDNYVKVAVEEIEPLGPFDIVDLKVGDGILRGSTRSRFVEKEGEEVWVQLDERRLHFFDADSGQSLDI